MFEGGQALLNRRGSTPRHGQSQMVRLRNRIQRFKEARLIFPHTFDHVVMLAPDLRAQQFQFVLPLLDSGRPASIVKPVHVVQL